jgi:hypothetical protein
MAKEIKEKGVTFSLSGWENHSNPGWSIATNVAEILATLLLYSSFEQETLKLTVVKWSKVRGAPDHQGIRGVNIREPSDTCEMVGVKVQPGDNDTRQLWEIQPPTEKMSAVELAEYFQEGLNEYQRDLHEEADGGREVSQYREPQVEELLELAREENLCSKLSQFRWRNGNIFVPDLKCQELPGRLQEWCTNISNGVQFSPRLNAFFQTVKAEQQQSRQAGGDVMAKKQHIGAEREEVLKAIFNCFGLDNKFDVPKVVGIVDELPKYSEDDRNSISTLLSHAAREENQYLKKDSNKNPNEYWFNEAIVRELGWNYKEDEEMSEETTEDEPDPKFIRDLPDPEECEDFGDIEFAEDEVESARENLKAALEIVSEVEGDLEQRREELKDEQKAREAAEHLGELADKDPELVNDVLDEFDLS